MKKIAIFDTSISNMNLGNQIIVDAVRREVKRIFPHDFIYHVPATEFINGRLTKQILSDADFLIYAGTNVLRSDMDNPYSEWCIRPTDRFPSPVIMLGAGWWQYQEFGPNDYTKKLLHNVIHLEAIHSVRDQYTVDRLTSIGFKAQNTGCPTIWDLTPAHCASIPTTKSESAITTLTNWKHAPDQDRQMLSDIRKNYEKVYFWPQNFDDSDYLRHLDGGAIEMIDPTLEAYDEALRTLDADFVGNRLHGGIRALQHGRRTIIIAVDNRANEMGRDFNLPVCPREDVATRLADLIRGDWKTEIRLPDEEISSWRNQFRLLPEPTRQPEVSSVKPSIKTRVARKIISIATKSLSPC